MYTLDAFGGLYPDGQSPTFYADVLWPNWNIARSVKLSPQSTAAQPQGWTVDGYGGLHPFGGAPAVASGGYSLGRDLAVQLIEG